MSRIRNSRQTRSSTSSRFKVQGSRFKVQGLKFHHLIVKIRYTKKRLFSSLILGGMFAAFGLLRLLEEPENSWLYYLQLLFGLFAVGAYFYERHFQYLLIENGILTKNSIRRKSLQLDKITRIHSLPGRIKLFTSEEKLSINTELIEDDSRNDLLKVLGSLEVEHNPFIGYSPKTS